MSKAIVFLVLNSLLFNVVECGDITVQSSRIGQQSYKLHCPKLHFVAALTLNKGVSTDFSSEPWSDVAFDMECRPFRGSDSGKEACRTKAAFELSTDQLLIDNEVIQCTCDEYLAGVTSELKLDSPHPQKAPKRM